MKAMHRWHHRGYRREAPTLDGDRGCASSNTLNQAIAASTLSKAILNSTSVRALLEIRRGVLCSLNLKTISPAVLG